MQAVKDYVGDEDDYDADDSKKPAAAGQQVALALPGTAPGLGLLTTLNKLPTPGGAAAAPAPLQVRAA